MKNSSNYYMSILHDLDTFDYSKLPEDNKLTYDILKTYASNEIDFADLCINYQPFSPTIGIQAQLPILLSQYTLGNEKDVISYLKTLSSIDDYFKSAIEFEKVKADAGCYMSNKTLSDIVSQCNEFTGTSDNLLISSFNERIDNIKFLSVNKRNKYIAINCNLVNKVVIPSYQYLAKELSDLSPKCSPHLGLSQFETGKEYYQYLIRSTTGSDKTVSEIEKMINTQLHKDIYLLNTLCENSDVSAILSGQINAPNFPKDTIQKDYLSIINHDSKATSSSTSNQILKYLIKKMTTDFPPPASTNFILKEVPASLSSHLSPAFYLSPQIDDPDNNVIFINKPEQLSCESLFTTLAHEGFPGHLYQTTYFLEKSPSLIRYTLDCGGYSEGWATYAELYAYKYLYKDSKVRNAIISNSRFSLALYCLADIGINYHGWSLDDTKDFFAKYSVSDTETVNKIYDCMIEEPANYLKYYVGYLEFMHLKESMKKKRGDAYSDIEFHRFVLENGPAPFSILKKYLDLN
jgi:uncharacterized protein (DUF885 family)